MESTRYAKNYSQPKGQLVLQSKQRITPEVSLEKSLPL